MERGHNFRTEPLGKGVFVAFDSEFGFTTDSFILAALSRPIDGEARVCDLCCGCGIVSAVWLRDGYAGRIDAVDIQAGAVRLAGKTAELSGCAGRMNIIEGDLRQPGLLADGGYDMVAANPPFFPAAGEEAGSRAVARRQFYCGEGDIILAAAGCLREGGRLFICQRPRRAEVILGLLGLHGFGERVVTLAAEAEGRDPFLAVISAVKGGEPGGVSQRHFFLRDGGGGYTKEYKSLYGEYYGDI